LATYVGRFDVETAVAFTLPAKLLHVMTLLDAFDVMLEGREPSSHIFSPVSSEGQEEAAVEDRLPLVVSPH
jgi:hypothetical protein